MAAAAAGCVLAAAPILLAVELAPSRGVIGAPGSDRLEERFGQRGYDLERVVERGEPVPRLFASRFPDDWIDLNPSARRKRLFVMVMLPLILNENERILSERLRISRLLKLADRGRRDQRWLRDRARAYGVSYGRWSRLLSRVDQVPPSLALAQAAIESGWGTSRFVHEGNAVFGQRTWTRGTWTRGTWVRRTWTRSRAMTPERRDPGATHAVSRFRNLGRSVAAYLRNLNTHPAYARFRARRAEGRLAAVAPSGLELSGLLDRYSETGDDYVDQLRGMIRDNRLDRFDRVRLAAPKN